MYNYELDTSLLPKVWLTWASTKNKEFNKRFWLNCQTGEKKERPEPWMAYDSEDDITRWYRNSDGRISYKGCRADQDRMWTYPGANIMFFYAKYHEDIEKLELAAVTMDSTRKEEVHPWKWAGKRYFLGKDKSVVDINGNTTNKYELYEYHDAYDAKHAINILSRLCHLNTVIEEFKKFIGASSFPIGNGNIVNITCAWHIQRWYETSQKIRGKGKEQKLTDELTAIPLKDFSGFAVKYPEKAIPHSYGTYRIKDIVYFERVNDNWSVLRSFHRNAENTLTENWRMYISDDGKNRIATPTASGWVPATQRTYGWYYNKSRLVNKREAINGCNRCKYILNSFNSDIKEVNEVHTLVTALRFPEVEQLMKLGYTKDALNIISTNQVKANFKHTFGDKYNDKETNILKKVGLTKKQFDAFMAHRKDGRYGWSAANTLKMLRNTYGEKLIHIDGDTFAKLLRGYSRLTYYWGEYNLDDICAAHSLDKDKFINNMIRLGNKDDRDYQLIWDTYCQHRRLREGTAPTINWYFDDHSDIVRAHNAVTAIYNEQERERRALYDLKEAERRKAEEKKRIEVDKKRKEYEFEDDDYIIRLPKNVLEIITEGSTQHICIGSYTTRHSLGETNLFFLRKKSAPDDPFYAIEMDNHKNIVQIHGTYNVWLGAAPEAIPTVIRWCRKHDIKCDKTILTCKARGYGRTNDYVEMPTVDGKKGI